LGWQKDFKIFDIRKNLPLNDEEPLVYDYYTSMGRDQGVEKGALLTVYRRVPVMDMYRNQSHDDMHIPVAKIQIIYADRTMSVGRVVKRADPDKIPVLEFSKIMAGDRVEFSNLTIKADNAVFGDRTLASVEASGEASTKNPSSNQDHLTPSPQANIEVKATP
jgi:hypothetical protein